jgi:hypothetical protein
VTCAPRHRASCVAVEGRQGKTSSPGESVTTSSACAATTPDSSYDASEILLGEHTPPHPVSDARVHVDEILDQWRTERPDLEAAALGLYGRLFRVVQLSGEQLAQGLAEYGLQPGWFDLLAALRRAGAP